MPTILTRTIGSGKDYATFTAAEAATPTIGTSADLVTNDEAIVFEADAGTYSESFTIDGGLTCDATRNVTYTFASGAYHGGAVGTGVVISGGTTAVTVKEEHTNLVGLEAVTTSTSSGAVIWVEGYGYNGTQCKDLIVWSGNSLFDATGGNFASIRQRNPIASYDPPTQMVIENVVFNSTGFGIGVSTSAADVGNNVAIRNCTVTDGRFATDTGAASTPSGVTRNVELHNNLDLDNVGVLFGAQASTGYTGTATNVARNSTWPSSLRAGSQLWTVTTDDTASSTGSQVIYSGTTAELYDVAGNDAWQYLTSLTNAPATSIDSVTRLGTGFNPGAFEADAGGGSGPPQVTTPSPADDATDVSITVDPSWAASSGATGYDVWWGTTSGALTKVSSNQAGLTYDPGTLNNATEYFWRVDSVNAGGTTTGVEWSFTTIVAAPAQVTTPSPANAATGVAITVDPSWAAASGATGYDVWFGTTSGALTEVSTNQPGLTYDPGVLTNNVTYFWRIDSVNVGGTTTGVEWSFTTIQLIPDQATTPDPANAATDVAITADLGWDADANVDTYDVWFGTTSGALTEVSAAQAGVTYDPGTLSYSTTYFWRIDTTNPIGTTTGVEWSFTTRAAPGDSIWDELVADHTEPGSFGELIQQIHIAALNAASGRATN